MSAKPLSAAATLLAIVALVALWYGQGILATGPVGITIQAAAAIFFLWARLTMGWRSFHATANPMEDAPLVTRGPYRLVRHPIYAALWVFAWTGVATNATPLNVALGLVIAACLLARMLLEEAELRRRYPEYADYARRTKRILPFVI